MSGEGVLDRLMAVLFEAAAPSDTVKVRAGYWGKSTVFAKIRCAFLYTQRLLQLNEACPL